MKVMGVGGYDDVHIDVPRRPKKREFLNRGTDTALARLSTLRSHGPCFLRSLRMRRTISLLDGIIIMGLGANTYIIVVLCITSSVIIICSFTRKSLTFLIWFVAIHQKLQDKGGASTVEGQAATRRVSGGTQDVFVSRAS